MTILLTFVASLGITTKTAAAVVDVIGHLSVSEFNTYIAPQSYRDWGNEPCLAVNPLNPQEMIISTFAYGSWISSSTAQLWHSTNGGASWSIAFSIPTPFPGNGYFVDDQSLAYDKTGVLHCAMLAANLGYDFVYHGTSTNVNNSSGWTWNATAINTVTYPDQPWIALSGNSVAVGYDNFNSAYSFSEERVAISTNNGVTFSSSMDTAVCSPGRVNTSYTNPGLRVAADNVGDFFMICGIRTNDNGATAAYMNYRLNRYSVGSTNWDFTTATPDPIGGLMITNGQSRQGNYAPFSFGNINYLLGNITAIAANTNGSRVYVVYGLSDVSNIGHLYLQKFQPSGTNLVKSGTPLMFSSASYSAALPEVAVADNGAVGLLYDEFDGANFHIHFALSLDEGATVVTNMEIYSFATNGIVLGYGTTNHNRLLGDYQVMRANSNSFYAAFAARGNVSTGNITTNFIGPFFFSYDATFAPPVISGITLISGGNVKIGFTGTPGATYFVQAATNLISPVTWQSLFTNVADNGGKWSFTNPSTSYQMRFYRGSLKP